MSKASAGALWSRSDVRARAVSLVVLGILAGLTIGLATAAFDGARRTDSALDRLRGRTNASDAVVFATQVNVINPDWTALSQRPEVERLARWGLAFGNVDGDPDGTLFVPTDDVWLNTVDRPVVVAGRMFDPQAADEVVVTDDLQYFDDGSPIEVGSTFPFTAMSKDGVFGQPPSGPEIEMRVVGIIHSPLTYTFTGGAFVSPGFVTKFGDTAYVADNALVTLRNGPVDAPALRRHAGTDVAEGVPVLDLHVTSRRVTATTDVEGAMLRLLGGIVALAGIAFVGQALSRSAGTIGSDTPALRALGMTRREMLTAAVRPHVLTAAIAAVLTTVTATVASRWFPVGLAGGVDPDRGIRIDVALVLAATILSILLTLGVAAFGGWRASRPTGGPAARQSIWLSYLPIARPVALRVGARMAFDGGGSSRRSSAWPALIGAVAAVTGVVAIVTVNHGLTDAIAHPEVAGVAWDATVIPKTEDASIADGVDPALIAAIAKQPGVAAVASVGRYVSQIGELGVPVFTVVEPDAGPSLDLVTLSGRTVEADDEIVLGPSTARDLGVEVGDTVSLADGASAEVVGLGLFPSDVHSQFDEGAVVSNDRWTRLAGMSPEAESEGTLAMLAAVRFTDQQNSAAEIGALSTALGPSVQGVFPVDRPLELSNLHNIRTLPTVLSVFLAVLGAVAIGHALFSSVYRRRRDLAVMQSMGVTRRGVRLMIAAQATVVGVAGIVIGVPLGLIAGQAGWQAITQRVPLTFRSPMTLVAVVLVVPIALLAANLLAVIPARQASKAKPALVLRSE